MALAGGMRYWELAAAPAVAAILVAAQRLRASRRKAEIENRMLRSLAALIIKVGDSESEPAIGGRPRVLVADDHLANGEVAKHILTGLGARVDVTSNGREAIERMRVAMYDLVLMDCQMPGMTGPDAVEKIRRAEGPEWHTPIVAMTTGAEPGCDRQCLSCGMDDRLEKPMRRESMEEVWERWVAVTGAQAIGMREGENT